MKSIFFLLIHFVAFHAFAQNSFEKKLKDLNHLKIAEIQNNSFSFTINQNDILETINFHISNPENAFSKMAIESVDYEGKKYAYLKLTNPVINRNLVIGLTKNNNSLELATTNNSVFFSVFEGFSGCFPRFIKVDDEGLFLFNGRDLEMCVMPDYAKIFPCESTRGFFD